MNSEFGPPCAKCGHPARNHDTMRCTFVPEGRRSTCSCFGYEPGETQSLDTELLMINRNALMDIREVVRDMGYVAPGVLTGHRRQITAILNRVGLE